MTSRTPDEPDAAPEVSKPRLLIVDDEAATRRLLASALEKLGFSVNMAANGGAAWDQIAVDPPALVVLDFELPDMNGADLCVRLRQSGRPELIELPIIVLTAHDGDSDEVRCLNAGANDFVTKPVSIAVLSVRIQTQIRLSTLRRELQEQNRELEDWRRVREMDLQAAQATQRAIVPVRPPEITGWDVAAFYQPLIEVGGDVYGWEPLDRSHWLFWIADATGHGAAAALLTTLSRLLFQHAGGVSRSPAEILRLVNEEFFTVFNGRSFFTAACLVVRPDRGRIVFASAGHPPLIVVRANGSTETVKAGGPLLGIAATIEVEEATTQLETGDMAMLYTDGLVSGTHDDGERCSFEDLRGYVAVKANANATLEATLHALSAATRDGEFTDDLAAIALQRTAPREPARPAAVRRRQTGTV